MFISLKGTGFVDGPKPDTTMVGHFFWLWKLFVDKLRFNPIRELDHSLYGLKHLIFLWFSRVISVAYPLEIHIPKRWIFTHTRPTNSIGFHIPEPLTYKSCTCKISSYSNLIVLLHYISWKSPE